MVQTADGMNYAPKGKPNPVVAAGEFVFAAMALDHGHIYGQCNGLIEAGATLTKVYDPDPAKVAKFVATFPQATPVDHPRAILEDESIRLVAAAAIPCDRGPLGCKVMRHGKDYFTDKAPFTKMAQLEEAKKTVAETRMKYAVYYSERLHVECAVHAGTLIDQGTIGKVIQVIGLGPHRLSASSRPAWFFEKAKYGGILTDIGSHQIEQFLHYTGSKDATILASKVGNYANQDHPELEDFGDLTLVGDTGATGYHRVDWFNPDGLSTWGDGRTFILGTEGSIELRKYCDVGRGEGGNQIYLVDNKGEHHFHVTGQVGYPYFGHLIKDCLDRTETAMTQAHAFKAAELCLEAQARAITVAVDGGRPTWPG